MPASGSLDYDAVIVGSGPNGLAAAITLAQAGNKVLVIEGKATVGGGLRTEELTLPGFHHDVCSAIHPLGMGSPFFRALPLDRFGLEWIQPDIPMAHPFDDGTAAALHQGFAATATTLGQDGDAWCRVFGPLAASWERIAPALLGPNPISPHLLDLTRFGLGALQPAAGFAARAFATERGRALFGGLAAHAIRPLEHLVTASFGLVLGTLGHAVGWPLPRGGSAAIATAMTRYLQSLGGDVVCGWTVTSLAELPPARVTLLDVTPRQFLTLARDRLPPGYRRQLNAFRYGPGVFKLDYALAGPVPWLAAACRRAGTVHVGGTLAALAQGEREVWRGRHPEKPYVLVAQQSLFDPSRAPAGRQTLWTYCHVPNRSTVDMTGAIEAQLERFAPGFRDLVLARDTRTAAELETYSPNYVGGDINGGISDLRQLWTRPVPRWNPYSTPLDGVYLCSSSTPPGGGVHGMCGYHAARSALARLAAG